MKGINIILVILLLTTLFTLTAAGAANGEALDEAINIMRECGNDPGEEDIARLHSLGLSDDDIEDLAAVSSLSADDPGKSAAKCIGQALAVFCAAVLSIIAVAVHGKSAGQFV